MLSKKILNAFHFISLSSPSGSSKPEDVKTEESLKTLSVQVLNAVILGGVACFTTLSSNALSGLPINFQTVFISFGLAFFISLAGQRGLKTGGST